MRTLDKMHTIWLILAWNKMVLDASKTIPRQTWTIWLILARNKMVLEASKTNSG